MNIDLSDKAKTFKPGKYRHFKGGEYEAIGVAIHTESLEELVLYRARDGRGRGKFFARPLDMFIEEVDKPEYNYRGSRFSFVAE